MLSRARCINEKVMQTKDKNWTTTSHQVAHQVSIKPQDKFNVSIMFKDTYEGQESNPFKFFLHERHLWRHPKQPTKNPLRVICKDNIRRIYY